MFENHDKLLPPTGFSIRCGRSKIKIISQAMIQFFVKILFVERENEPLPLLDRRPIPPPQGGWQGKYHHCNEHSLYSGHILNIATLLVTDIYIKQYIVVDTSL